jgi:succinyldiaminopimelate transaminase
VSTSVGFQPPVYPYERLAPTLASAGRLPGGVIDLSIGTPTDPPPDAVLEVLASADRDGAARGYPASVGTEALRAAISTWTRRRFDVELDTASVAVCIGTKEFVATLPQWLRLRAPDRDTVLYPELAYPTYEMGAVLGGCRPVAVPVLDDFGIDLSAISEEDAARAVVLWVNSPGNPAGQLDDLVAAARWGRERGVPVFSDECYAEFTWTGPPRTILSDGLDGVVAVHSLSKRSNLAGLRLGWYAGDAALVHYLSEVRKHAGMMVAGPVQAAGIVALADQSHVDAQRARYLERLERMIPVLAAAGAEAVLPDGGFYLWARVRGGDAWDMTEQLAVRTGALVAPGDIYGPAGRGYVRAAMVQPLERLDVVAARLGV